MSMRPENTKFEHGKLKVVGSNNHPGGPDSIEFVFNPQELSVKAGALWEQPAQAGAKKSSKPTFKGPEPRSMEIKFILDGWDHTRDVHKDLETLVSWTRPTGPSRGKTKPSPPTIELQWGPKWFPCYVASVSSTITVFDRDGMPLRATVSVSLKELPDDKPGQNPTSGSLVGHQSHVLTQGESLASVAHRYYERPSYWRGIAKANGIDDPTRLRPGSRLYLPPLADVAEASR